MYGCSLSCHIDQSCLFVYLFVKPRKTSDKTKQYKICPTSHLKIQDGGYFSRWPPSGARDNDIPHKLVSIQPILVIFVSNGMF